MPAQAEPSESEAVCGAEGLTQLVLPGPASGIAGECPSWGSTWLHPEPGLSSIPEKHREEDRPLEWETLRADETLTATRVFGFYWGMLQANCTGGPLLEVTAQQQPACTNSYRPHTRHGSVHAHPTDRSRGGSGA